MNFFSRVSIFRLWRQITRPYLLKTVRTFQKTPKISCFAKTKTRFFSNLRSNHHFLTKMGLNCADFNSLQIHWNNFYHETNDSWDIERFETAHRAALGSPHQFSSFELWRQSLKLARAKRNSLLYLILLWWKLDFAEIQKGRRQLVLCNRTTLDLRNVTWKIGKPLFKLLKGNFLKDLFIETRNSEVAKP